MKRIIVLISLIIPLVSAAQPQPKVILNGHKDCLNVVAFSPDSKILLSGSKDGSVLSWEVNEGFRQINKMRISDASVSALSFNSSGDEFATGTYRKLSIYRTADFKKQKSKRKAHETFIESVDFSVDDKYIVSSSWKLHALTLWTANDLKRVRNFAESVWTDDALFSNDGKYVLSANHSSNVKVWDVATGNIIRTFAGHEDWIYALKLTSDQQTLITGSFDKTLKLWDFQSGRIINTLQGHTEGVYLLALTPDNNYLLSYALDFNLKIWDIKTGVEVGSFKTLSKVMGMAVSPDGMYLAAGLEDHTIAIWDIKELLLQK